MLQSENLTSWLTKRLLILASLAMVSGLFLTAAVAQTDDTFGDNGADPVKLFERAQGAHARGDLDKALELYQQAIKIRPEFPEAEFQVGNILTSQGKYPDAEAAFRRAIELKKSWSLPYSGLGALLMRVNRDDEAEKSFRQAISIDTNDNLALRLLSEIRLRAGDVKEALELAKRATASQDAPASAWLTYAMAQRANGDKLAARSILDRLIKDQPDNVAALLERADLSTDEKTYDSAIEDLKTASKLRSGDKVVLARLAYVYQQAGKQEEAAAAAKAAGLQVQATTDDGKIRVIGTPEEIEAANSDDAAVARKALEKLIEKNPENASLLNRLGLTYRTENPNRALELLRRAAELEPSSAEYAQSYASALVQLRRFQEAAQILKQVIRKNPESYTAHANLATALYEAKFYRDAIPEYEWIIAAKPELAVVHFFLATSHDYLGEFPEALASYEKFLATADGKTNQLEIDKVNLRLPTLKRQIQLGEGVKKKP
ncbi:MAG TPA: tetratricopeptide repeat protein [Pyrinomonadaceae bacterium]|nr:tetratricopeptide repeat protein [Pyrinomonadaceae bacterium]